MCQCRPACRVSATFQPLAPPPVLLAPVLLATAATTAACTMDLAQEKPCGLNLACSTGLV